MREHVYVPERIANAETEYAVNALSYWLQRSGACEFNDAKERICRLLGWMCEKAGGNGAVKPKTEDAYIYTEAFYKDDDVFALRDWWHWRKSFSCGHVIEGEGPEDMRPPEVCPICGNEEDK